MTQDRTGERFGAWTLVRVDDSGKRALVGCECGHHRQIAVEALTSGESGGCGCRLTPKLRPDPARPQVRQTGFASELAHAEHRGGRQRHLGGGRT